MPGVSSFKFADISRSITVDFRDDLQHQIYVDGVLGEQTRLQHLLYHSNESRTTAVTPPDDTVMNVTVSMEPI